MTFLFFITKLSGNSDLCTAPPVKENAKKIAWKQNADMTCVASMADKDFFSSEQSHIMPAAGSVKIIFTGKDGSVSVLKDGLELQAGEVIDATRMNAAALKEFFVKEIKDCYDNKLMMSLRMKATMMKVSDPIIFGHCVKAFYSDVLAKHGPLFDELKVNVNNGIGDVYDKIKGHPIEEEIKADIMKQYETRPGLAMFDSNAGITNLHVPSDVIIDASIPNVIRDGGQMWNKDDKLEEVKCGHVFNIGLMAQMTEEYGSHDKTFEIISEGTITVIRTVYRRLEKFTCPPGKSPQVLRLLEMKIKTLDEAERNVTLSCDEIYLEQKYSYCPRLRQGFEAVKVKIRLNHFLNLISNRYYCLEGASFHGTRHNDTFQDANILRL